MDAHTENGQHFWTIAQYLRPQPLATGKIDFGGMFVALNGKDYPNLAAAKADKAAVLAYGSFINTTTVFPRTSVPL